MIQFGEYFSDGLKPPTRWLVACLSINSKWKLGQKRSESYAIPARMCFVSCGPISMDLLQCHFWQYLHTYRVDIYIFSGRLHFFGDPQRSPSRFVGAIHGIHSLPGAKVLRRFLGHRSRGAFFILVHCKVHCFFWGCPRILKHSNLHIFELIFIICHVHRRADSNDPSYQSWNVLVRWCGQIFQWILVGQIVATHTIAHVYV